MWHYNHVAMKGGLICMFGFYHTEIDLNSNKLRWPTFIFFCLSLLPLFFFYIFASLLRQAHALKNRSFGDGWSDGGAWAMRIKPQSLIRLYYYVNLKNNVCITLITALLLQRRHLNGWVCKCPFYIGRKSHLNTGDSCFIYGETKWVFRPFLSASCIYVI